MLNRSKLWAAMLLCGAFAAGVAVGGPAWHAFGNGGPDGRGRRSVASEPRDRERRSYSEHLQEVLNLTAEQRAAVDSILDENQSEMRQVWREMRAEIDTLRVDVTSAIMKLLDEEQQTKYSELLERSRRRGDREREPRNDMHYE